MGCLITMTAARGPVAFVSPRERDNLPALAIGCKSSWGREILGSGHAEHVAVGSPCAAARGARSVARDGGEDIEQFGRTR
eukprot:2741233-Pleurochrysis_carterae.AAC.2